MAEPGGPDSSPDPVVRLPCACLCERRVCAARPHVRPQVATGARYGVQYLPLCVALAGRRPRPAGRGRREGGAPPSPMVFAW